MPGVKYVNQGGKSILLMDFVGMSDYRDLPNLIDESIRLVQAAKVRDSILALVDLSKTRISREVISSLRRLSRNNGPFIRAIAFVGLSTPWSLLFSLLFRAGGERNHKVIHERGQALLWLVQQ